MVGVGKGRLRDCPGFVPFQSVQVDEDAHEFGDGDRRVGVVELDRRVVAERVDVSVLFDVTADEIEKRSGGEEVFLSQAELLSSRRRVARIEHLGNGLRPHGIR